MGVRKRKKFDPPSRDDGKDGGNGGNGGNDRKERDDDETGKATASRGETSGMFAMISGTTARRSIGLVLWIAAGLYIYDNASSRSPASGSTLEKLETYFLRQELHFDIRLPVAVGLSVGDLVYLDAAATSRLGIPRGEAIGDVAALLNADGELVPDLFRTTHGARVRIFDGRRVRMKADAKIVLLQVPQLAGNWVFHTLVPPEKLEYLRKEWQLAWRRESPEIYRRIAPFVSRLARDIQLVIERDSKPFLERHRPEIRRALERLESDIDDREMREIFETVAWPTLRQYFEPIAQAIGREVWDRLPVWSLSWRYAYQSLPLTENDHFKRRWQRFVDNEFTPLLKAYLPITLRTSRIAAREIFSDPRVRTVLHDLLIRVLGDDEFHKLGRLYVDEVLIANPHFRERVKALIDSDDFRGTLKWISGRFELTIRRLADSLFGTQATGISPEFAKVLRAQILNKGKMRLEVSPGSAEAFLASGAHVEAGMRIDKPGARRGR